MPQKFDRKKEIALDGQPIVRFTQFDPEPPANLSPLVISATASGMKIYGHLVGEFETENDLENFANVVTSAWKDHLVLQKALRTKLMGGL